MFDEENVFSLFLPPCTMYDDGNVCIKLLLLMAFPLRKRVRNGSAAKVALRTDTKSGRRPAQSSCLSNEKFFNDNDEQSRAVLIMSLRSPARCGNDPAQWLMTIESSSLSFN
jgi:hypothetical protein